MNNYKPNLLYVKKIDTQMLNSAIKYMFIIIFGRIFVRYKIKKTQNIPLRYSQMKLYLLIT